MDVQALRDVLHDRLVPELLDLEVGVVEARAGYGYGYIFIPAQDPEALPILVAGALADGPSLAPMSRSPTAPASRRSSPTRLASIR